MERRWGEGGEGGNRVEREGRGWIGLERGKTNSELYGLISRLHPHINMQPNYMVEFQSDNYCLVHEHVLLTMHAL